MDFDGTATLSPEVEARVDLATAFRLTAFPNPFARTAEVEVAAAQAQRVEVAVHDVLGRRVATLFDGRVAANSIVRARLDGTGLPPGLCLVRVRGERFTEVLRLTRAR